jgi:GH24 family phage-related lysozyme (muramidase)
VRVHPDAIIIIKDEELFMAEPYMDHGHDGPTPAQGYGHRIGPPFIPTLHPDGTTTWAPVGDTWTEEFASKVLAQDIEERVAPFRKWLEDNGRQLTARQFGACISLIYNRGWTAFKKTQVAYFILAEEVTNHMVKAGNAFVDDENCKAKDKKTGEIRVFAGLKRRRIREGALFHSKQGD